MKVVCVLVALVCGELAGCSSKLQSVGVAGWIEQCAVPIREVGASTAAAREVCHGFDRARVVALGEATHGQHESFEIKRAITMHLIREHGYRIVAYEASASKAAACEAYVSGASADLNVAMRGFGMMIWDIEENAALLGDLREWNQQVPAERRVRFVGVDVQDVQACAARLGELLGQRWANEASALKSIQERLDGAAQQMFGGDRSSYDDLVREGIEVVERIRAATAGEQIPAIADLRSALAEFEGGVQTYLAPGRRDKAMADMTLGVLKEAGEDAKIVLWAHNGHVGKSPLRYLGSDELAAGGHLAAALGEQYLAIGFSFGSGDFVANDQKDGKWWFRTYGVDPAPEGSLESWFMPSVREASIIDLRRDTGIADVERWKRGGHGQRWFGGYKVPEDVREVTRDVSQLLPTYPREAFDAMVFVPRTTGSTPRDRAKIWDGGGKSKPEAK